MLTMTDDGAFRGHRLRRTTALLTLTGLALLVGAGTATAHVAVDPSTATAGDEAVTLTFRVPNESATASTVAVTVTLPTDHPFADVSVGQASGWTVSPTKQTLPSPVTEGDLTIKEAVTSVTWTAQAGSKIGPGEFAEFEISAGPVPGVASLEFPTTQTYDDGTVVEWNEPTPASGAEPEHPVPTLTLTPAGDAATESGAAAVSSPSDETGTSTEAGTATVSAAASTESGTAQSTGSTDGTASTAVILAVIGIVVAAAALLTAAVALRRLPTTGEKT